jgi:predicted TIM-barrel fold metal-dependent hydrolase
MTHCSGAALRAKKFKGGRGKLKANSYCSPNHAAKVLRSHPRLRFCLGHFGGDAAWTAYLKKPLLKDRMRRNEPGYSGTENWLHDIIDMLDSGSFPNLFVDIAYVIFHYRDNINILKVLLDNPRIRDSVLFGTDYYMVEIEKFSEKKLSIFLRAQIGESHYRQIAEINPTRYLFGPSRPIPRAAID